MSIQITDVKSHAALRKLVDTIFDANVTVPEQVYRALHWRYLLSSFDDCFSPSLLRACATIARTSNDDGYWLIMLDPDPIAYYYKEFHRLGAIYVQVDDDPDTSWEMLEEAPEGSPADAMVYIVNRFVVVAHSMQWGVWGSRGDGVVIWGAERDEIIRGAGEGRCIAYDLHNGLERIGRRDTAFKDSMRRNYEWRSRLET